MLLVEGLWRCFFCCSWFPWQKYTSSSKKPQKTVGTWSSKFCQLNNTNSSLVPFIKKVYNPGWEVLSSHLHNVRARDQSWEKFLALKHPALFHFCFFFLAMNTTACLVAWRQFEGKSRFKRKKTVGHRFVQGSANVHICPLPRPLEPSTTDHPSLISVSSCGELGDLTLKTPGRISGTGTAGGLCVSCSGGWAHPNAQTSSRSPPSRSGKASPLCVCGGAL